MAPQVHGKNLGKICTSTPNVAAAITKNFRGKTSDGIEAVSIATPNFTYFEIAKAALETGLHVYCEKTLYFTVAAAEELATPVEKSDKVMFISCGYAGHRMIEQARQMVANRKNPERRLARCPEEVRPTFVIGDVEMHSLYLREVIFPELKIKHLIMCTRQSFVEECALEDNAMTITEYDSGAIISEKATAFLKNLMVRFRE